METGHDEPKAFDIILLLLLRGRRVVTGYEPITFAQKISYPNENQDYCEKTEIPNHINSGFIDVNTMESIRQDIHQFRVEPDVFFPDSFFG